ncbi:hypothetical protein MNR01_10900 [Lysobacter sp. S4-A87]|uniref:hypothetical protein n=1 Tax=Lysobacter sp. S4-A87 TaxID=2925843 RepID=UPI001F53453A|nr:hypothetical protein [Lysobacter sp. S4-A87]UNK48281.1 hypothetical protein MNR01_10900 [Lysobacter sp. S4-A87]
MRNVMAFVYFLLGLVGGIGEISGISGLGATGTTLVARSTDNGVETLLSKTSIETGKVRFECMRSATGHCHYALFTGTCTTSAAGAHCVHRPAGTFDVQVGQVRDRSDLPADFRLCVSHRSEAVDADCRPAG